MQNDIDDGIMIDVCGDQFELSKKLSCRIPFALALGMCSMIIIIVFIDECVFSDEVCSDQIPYCYLFTSRFTLYDTMGEFVCRSNKSVIPVNMSVTHALCYSFVLPRQSKYD